MSAPPLGLPALGHLHDGYYRATIITHRVMKDGQREYLIDWEDYPSSEWSWVAEKLVERALLR